MSMSTPIGRPFSSLPVNGSAGTGASPTYSQPQKEVRDDLLLENRIKQSDSWNVRAISKLQEWEKSVDDSLPSNKVQRVLDNFYADHLKPILDSPKAQALNDWIDRNGGDKWYKQLCSFLLSLPIRSVRNILRIVYSIVKAAVYTVTHPVKAFFKLMQFLVEMVHTLSKPEMWTKIGAGMIGASVGQFLVTAGPHSLILAGAGAGILIIGLLAGAISSALSVKEERGEAVKKELWNHLKSIPEAMLTGFIMGMIFGAIQNQLQTRPMPERDAQLAGKTPKPPDQATVQNYLNNHVFPSQGYPPASTITFNPLNGEIIATWKAEILGKLTNEGLKIAQVLKDNIQSVQEFFRHGFVPDGNFALPTTLVTSAGNDEITQKTRGLWEKRPEKTSEGEKEFQVVIRGYDPSAPSHAMLSIEGHSGTKTQYAFIQGPNSSSEKDDVIVLPPSFVNLDATLTVINEGA